jgi:molybdopterin-guanine dinucleotide biosynthesis protein A
VIGALLAGGSGSRLGSGSKAAAALGGRPLAAYPAAALAEVCERVAVVCKRDTALPDLPATERWEEPDEPRHPLTGIVHALERAHPEPVLVCAGDMPFVTPAGLRALAAHGTTAVAVAGGVLQPVLGLYTPDVLPALRSAEPDAPLTRTVEALRPELVPLPPAQVRSIDTPEDLASAEVP